MSRNGTRDSLKRWGHHKPSIQEVEMIRWNTCPKDSKGRLGWTPSLSGYDWVTMSFPDLAPFQHCHLGAGLLPPHRTQQWAKRLRPPHPQNTSKLLRRQVMLIGYFQTFQTLNRTGSHDKTGTAIPVPTFASNQTASLKRRWHVDVDCVSHSNPIRNWCLDFSAKG